MGVSPCAPANSPCGVLIGAAGVECNPLPVLFASVVASFERRTVHLRWSVESDEEIAGFSVVRTTGGTSKMIAEGLAANAREFADRTAEPNTGYRYAVIATTSDGNIFQSQGIDARTPRATLELSQNQPNPFNPVTRITYSLAEPSLVDLGVFDVSGKRVVTLVSGLRSAGSGTVEWRGVDDKGNGVGSGVYFCRLTAGSDVRTVKMVLLK